MEEIYSLFKKAKDIIFFTGAGVSTNCGLPDFRGDNGIYSYVEKKYKLPYPEAIFDLEYFEKDSSAFFKLSKELLSSNVEPSITHNFVSWLESKGKLKLTVTQNIDMLHEKSGTKNTIACHGTYSSATCKKCGKAYTYKDIEQKLLLGETPYCTCKGVIKPDITFFGENLPQSFYDIMDNPPDADLLIVMGTSLNVQPAASFPLLYRGKCPIIIVNREETVYDKLFDKVIKMDCDKFTNEIWNKLREEDAN